MNEDTSKNLKHLDLDKENAVPGNDLDKVREGGAALLEQLSHLTDNKEEAWDIERQLRGLFD